MTGERKLWLWLFSSSKLHIQISEDNSFNRHKKVNGGKRSLEFHKNFRFGCFSLSLFLLFLSKPFPDNVRCYNRKNPPPETSSNLIYLSLFCTFLGNTAFLFVFNVLNEHGMSTLKILLKDMLYINLACLKDRARFLFLKQI